MYNLHLYTHLSKTDALRAGTPGAGTRPLALDDAKAAQLRDHGLIEAAEPYLDGTERDQHARNRTLIVAGPSWDDAVTALKMRADAIATHRATLAIPPSWDAAQRIARFELPSVDHLPADLANGESGGKAAELVYFTKRVVVWVTDARAAGAWKGPTGDSLTRISRVRPWLPEDAALLLESALDAERQKEESRRQALLDEAYDYIHDPEARTVPVERGWFPQDLIDAIRAAQRERAQIDRTRDAIRRAERRAKMTEFLAQHGSVTQRERWAAGLMTEDEVLGVQADHVFARLQPQHGPLLTVVDEPCDEDDLAESIPDNLWPRAREILFGLQSPEILALDPEPAVKWFRVTNQNGAVWYAAEVAIETPLGVVSRTFRLA